MYLIGILTIAYYNPLQKLGSINPFKKMFKWVSQGPVNTKISSWWFGLFHLARLACAKWEVSKEKHDSSWWLNQPWKRFVKMGIFSKVRVKYKIFELPPPRKSLYKPFESFVFGNCALFAKTISFFGSEPLVSSSNTSGVRIKITLLRVIPTMTCWVEVVRWGLSLRIWWEEWRIWKHWFQVSLA